MLKQFRMNLANWLWKTNYCERPSGFCDSQTPNISCSEDALALSPVYAALDLYKRTISTLPLVTYQKQDKGRERAKQHPAFKILHDKPNNGMTMIQYLEIVIHDYFMHGEHLSVIQWKNNNNINAIYPIPHNKIMKVTRDADWNKTYRVATDDGQIDVIDADAIHILKDSLDGIHGRSIVDFALSNLSLHKQVQTSANAYYKNAAKPSVYVQGEFGNKEATQAAEQAFNEKYSGTANSGKAPFLKPNTTISPFPNTTAEEARVVEMLSSSVADVARWFALSPLQLSDLTRGTYSNLSADNESFYQKSIRPLLVKMEAEFNNKIFTVDGDFYAAFLTDAILRGSPEQQQVILNGYITSGVMRKDEVREILDLPYIQGTEILTTPVNQAVVTGQADAKPLEQVV